MTHSKRAITAEDLLQLEVLSDPQMSPDGKGYAFVSTTINDEKEYETELFYYSFAESKIQQWTYSKGSNSNQRFSPDGKKVVFQSDRSGFPQIWLLSLDGGEAKQLTTFKNGATNPFWSKDGTCILFTARLKKDEDIHNQKEQTEEERQQEKEKESKEPRVITRLKYKADASGFLDEKKSQIILYDLKNESFSQLTTMDYDHLYEDISPDGETILFSANLNESSDYELTNDLYTFHMESKKMTKLTDEKGIFYNARFSPTGNKIVVFGHEFEYAGATLSNIYLFDVKSGEQNCISSAWDFELGDAMIGDVRIGSSEIGPMWSKDEQNIYFVGTDHGATGLYSVNILGELKVLYKNNDHVFGFSYDEMNDRFIVGISTPTDPGNFYTFEQEVISKLTSANENMLAEIKLSEPEELNIVASDGLNVQGWLLHPYGFEEGKKYPFVLEIHGGPHAMYGQTFFHELQLLAAKGYVVLYTNPRGSHGYGQEFVNACRHDYGGKDYEDVMDAVNYALKKYPFIDEDLLGVTGGSYGGFMTNWIVSHTNRFKAAVTQRSISNWLSFYGVSDIGYIFNKWEHGLDLLDDPEKLWDISPLKYAENVETPLLILHGEQDLRCPIEQAEQLFVTLKHLRKEVEFVRFPHANHELSRSGDPKLRIERLNHICRWFENYLV